MPEPLACDPFEQTEAGGAEGLGFRALGFRAECLGFRVLCLGFRVQGGIPNPHPPQALQPEDRNPSGLGPIFDKTRRRQCFRWILLATAASLLGFFLHSPSPSQRTSSTPLLSKHGGLSCLPGQTAMQPVQTQKLSMTTTEAYPAYRAERVEEAHGFARKSAIVRSGTSRSFSSLPWCFLGV